MMSNKGQQNSTRNRHPSEHRRTKEKTKGHLRTIKAKKEQCSSRTLSEQEETKIFQIR